MIGPSYLSFQILFSYRDDLRDPIRTVLCESRLNPRSLPLPLDFLRKKRSFLMVDQESFSNVDRSTLLVSCTPLAIDGGSRLRKDGWLYPLASPPQIMFTRSPFYLQLLVRRQVYAPLSAPFTHRPPSLQHSNLSHVKIVMVID